jgi:hypothetical protein
MFESSDVFVFTLGLTEAWVSEDDGAVVPLPPGVLGANVSPNKYVPQNFTFSDTFEDLRSLVRLFQLRNPTVRFIFTVSPVPLIATHDKKHVLEATTQSKSVLRAAAGEIANSFPHVAYFPSYEIITGSFNRGAYFAEDLREVTNAGVDHVMRIFLGHYGALRSSETLPRNTKSSSIPVSQQFRSETTFGMEIVCDEEEIVKAS